MRRETRQVLWQTGASLSDPLYLGGSAPTLIRLPVGWQGNGLAFVHYLATWDSDPTVLRNVVDLATAMDMYSGASLLTLDAAAGRAHLLLDTLRGAGWIALRAMASGVAQAQAAPRTGRLLWPEVG